MQEGSLFSTPSPAFAICGLMSDGHSERWEVVPHCRDSHTKGSRSERERQILYDITYMWNLKYGTGVPNLTSIHKDVGLIPGIAPWVKDPAFL